MAAKKKKKKSKKKPTAELIEFKLNFSDITIIEAEGVFSRVKSLVEEDIGPHNWNVKSDLIVESQFGAGHFELDLRSDKHIYILNYVSSTGNIYYNPDLSALMRWSQNNGWSIPQPHPALIRSNIAFWRQMWETLIIDSDYLDERYGVRKSLDMREIPKSEMEEAEEAEL